VSGSTSTSTRPNRLPRRSSSILYSLGVSFVFVQALADNFSGLAAKKINDHFTEGNNRTLANDDMTVCVV